MQRSAAGALALCGLPCRSVDPNRPARSRESPYPDYHAERNPWLQVGDSPLNFHDIPIPCGVVCFAGPIVDQNAW